MAWADDIISICEACLPAHYNDCSGFVQDVAARCGVLLVGDANRIVHMIAGSGWTQLQSGLEAAAHARYGNLVIAGAKGSTHGHVVVVVPGPLGHGCFPYAYWGQYHGLKVLGETVNVGFTRGHGTINWAFGERARKQLIYGATPASALLSGGAGEGSGSSWLPYLKW